MGNVILPREEIMATKTKQTVVVRIQNDKLK